MNITRPGRFPAASTRYAKPAAPPAPAVEDYSRVSMSTPVVDPVPTYIPPPSLPRPVERPACGAGLMSRTPKPRPTKPFPKPTGTGFRAMPPAPVCPSFKLNPARVQEIGPDDIPF
ncbi:hypothetical protein ACVWZK_003079 [Bradyrhizobium sp. GM0.4]